MKMSKGIVATICIWCIILVMRSSSAITELSKVEPLHLGDYPTETFDLQTGKKGYSEFLTRLRNRLAATKACDMPVTLKSPPLSSRYVLIDLKASVNKYVTLAINVSNVYLVAYRVGGKTDGVFFDEPDVDLAMANLFSKRIDKKLKLPYDSNYANIEKVGGSRENLYLGLGDLGKRIEAFYNQQPVTAKEEAQFLLMAIQMVSEAVRFKYIENLIVMKASFKPDSKMISLEKNWSKISKAVHKSSDQIPNQCVTVKDIVIDGKPVYLVSEIKKDVALLMYKDTSGSLISEIVASSIDDATRVVEPDLSF